MQAARTAPWWVKILLLLHVFCITVWSCPSPTEAVMAGRAKPFMFNYIRYWDELYLKPIKPLQTYLFTTGTWQYWDMFAPNPSNIDYWCDADIYFRNGSHHLYQYPRMFLLSIPEKYLKERYRKFFERAHDPKYQILFSQFGLRLALLNYHDPKNPPVRVVLQAHAREIAPPGHLQPEDYSISRFFIYEVDQSRLRHLATM